MGIMMFLSNMGQIGLVGNTRRLSVVLSIQGNMDMLLNCKLMSA